MNFLNQNMKGLENNKMKKKIFKVKDKWKIVDLMVALVVLIITAINLMEPIKEIILAFNNNDINSIQFVFILLFMIVVTMSSSIPGLIIYIIIRININKNKRKSLTFEAVNDIEYYRNDFGEMSPALISLMINLDIENKKDITAMLLYYKLNNVINISNDEIIINEHKKLTEADKNFLKWFKTKNVVDLAEWKNCVKKEGIEQGYIEQEKDRKNGCLIPIIGLVVTIVAFVFLCIMLVNTIENNSSDTTILTLIIPLIIMFFIIVNAVWLWMAYFISDKLSSKNIKRTKKGHELTEKIYAMKNFIHDFSSLSKVTKESLCMWEYFLIYAIVLEENETILNEIKEYYNDNFSKILLYEENLVDKNINTW